MLSEEPGGDGVEGAAPDAAAGDRARGCSGGGGAGQFAEDAVDAAEHFGSGAAGEGEQEDSFGWDAAVDQAGDAMGEGGGLAGAGAGDDQERRHAVCGRGPLLRVEAFEDRVERGGFGVHPCARLRGGGTNCSEQDLRGVGNEAPAELRRLSL